MFSSEQQVNMIAHETPSMDLHVKLAGILHEPRKIVFAIIVIFEYIEQRDSTMEHMIEARFTAGSWLGRHIFLLNTRERNHWTLNDSSLFGAPT